MKLDMEEELKLDQLYSGAVIPQEVQSQALVIASALARNRGRYEAAGMPCNVPWWVVAIIHQLEGGRDFSTHLHNGDPLTARTVNEPAGQPEQGEPPFSWEESALDAVRNSFLAKWGRWTASPALFALEAYNGFGYRRHAIRTPYCWSGTNWYTTGKFRSDGVFNPGVTSRQIGAVPIMKMLNQLKLADIVP